MGFSHSSCPETQSLPEFLVDASLSESFESVSCCKRRCAGGMPSPVAEPRAPARGFSYSFPSHAMDSGGCPSRGALACLLGALHREPGSRPAQGSKTQREGGTFSGGWQGGVKERTKAMEPGGPGLEC